MRTQIVLYGKRILLKEWHGLLSMSPQDEIDLNGNEYIVKYCNLDANEMIMHIVVEPN